jgi:predicted NBD/HSP70 family sugar kinase
MSPPLEAVSAYVARLLLRRGEMSRPELARALFLGPGVLEAMLGELPVGGMIIERRGRVAPNAGFASVVGVDMGASNLRFALADFSGTPLSAAWGKVRPEDGPQKTIAQIAQGIRRLVRRRKRAPLRAIAVSVPSPVDPKTRVATFANNLPGWKNIDLRSELEQMFRVPVEIENDANLAAIGEHWRGVARDKANFVFVALGTGIGSGIFADGRLYRGRTGSAGELFRLNVDWRRWREEFHETGFFENYVSGMGIAAAGRRVLGRLGGRRSSGLTGARDARFVFDAMRRGNPKARAVLDEIFTMLGVGVADLVAVLDPDLIVLGGGLVKGAPERMLSIVRKVVKTIHPGAPPVKLSALGDRAQIFGAIYSALEAACRLGLPEPRASR